MSDEATQRLDEGRRLLDAGDPDRAMSVLVGLTEHADPAISGGALLLVGVARYRTDDEEGALVAWRAAAEGGGPASWLGWRSLAEQHVRNGDLEDAITAYREADRRAPPDERGAIANRIAWLLKETGHDFAARRHFNRARGAYATYSGYVTYGIIAACVVVFGIDLLLTGRMELNFFGGGGQLVDAGLIWGPAVAAGEWWRIFTSAFLHLGLLHLAMNMYVLYLYGPVVEEMYGHVEFAVIYAMCAAGGSVLTILVEPLQPAAGASGAVFGLIGLAFVVMRRHHAVLTRNARAVMGSTGTYLVILIIFTFVVPGISWTGHLGGLAVGALIGFLLPPGKVATLGGMWRTPTGERLNRPMPLVQRLAVLAGVAAALGGGAYLAVQRLVG